MTAYEAASVAGRVRFRRRDEGAGWAFDDARRSTASNPLADQSTDRFAPLADERANPFPDRTTNAYPFAYEQVAQLFDSPVAPDLIAIHTAAHNWEDEGGHRGEHGSIDVVQARAPFILAGAGVARRGLVPESCRLVDVAPTVLALLGRRARARASASTARRRDDALLARQDGEAQLAMLDAGGRPPRPRDRLPLRRGQRQRALRRGGPGRGPNVARLMAMGTTMGHGAMSSLPDGHPGQPHLDHHRRLPRPPRHPEQRVVGPRLAASR